MRRCIPMSGKDAKILRHLVAEHHARTGELADVQTFLQEHPTHASLLEEPPELSDRERLNIVDFVERMHTDMPDNFSVRGWATLRKWLEHRRAAAPLKEEGPRVSLWDIPANSEFRAPGYAPKK